MHLPWCYANVVIELVFVQKLSAMQCYNANPEISARGILKINPPCQFKCRRVWYGKKPLRPFNMARLWSKMLVHFTTCIKKRIKT